ncbi:MAG: M42 family metallopeptidase [Candidatus Ranarchaeia archaeon]
MESKLDLSDPLRTLECLSDVIGVSGFEAVPRAIIREAIEPLADKVWVDPLGNLLAVKEGTKKGAPRILLDAHLDEVGFIVKYIDEHGFLFFSLLGGWDERVLPGHAVVLQHKDPWANPVHGVIGVTPPHLSSALERSKPIPVGSLHVDIGAASLKEVRERGVGLGSPGTLYQRFMRLSASRVLGKAFDDRCGCTALLHVLKRVQDEPLKSTLLLNFSVSEELGARGAATGAYTLQPDVAIAVETTTAADVPNVAPKDNPTSLGQGPAVTIADRSLIAHPRVVQQLIKVAESHNLPWQYKKPLTGGTDAGKIHLVRGGIPSGVVSIPCRYIHSPVSVLSPVDLHNTIELITGFLYKWK